MFGQFIGVLPDLWLKTAIVISFYSETTWADGIAQLTHHEVQAGGKNPETEGRWIFAPTAERVVSWLRNTDRPRRFAFIPHFIRVTICIF